MAEIAAWLLFQTPTIKGDDGAFLMAFLFLLTGAVAAGLMGLAWIMTGGTDIEDQGGRGQIK